VCIKIGIAAHKWTLPQNDLNKRECLFLYHNTDVWRKQPWAAVGRIGALSNSPFHLQSSGLHHQDAWASVIISEISAIPLKWDLQETSHYTSTYMSLTTFSSCPYPWRMQCFKIIKMIIISIPEIPHINRTYHNILP
jgi:hypothetical protein